MNRILFFILLLIPVASYGAGGEGVPFKFITIQAINFSLAVGTLIFLTRKTIAQAFKSKHDEFHAEVKKAESAKLEAEKKKKAINERLTKLKSNQQSDLTKAKAEAENLRKRILREAQELGEKMEQDAVRTAKFEYVKALEDLRKDLLARSVDMAQERMKDEVDTITLKRLRGEFVEKIQVVQ